MDPGRELGVRIQGSPPHWPGLSHWFQVGRREGRQEGRTMRQKEQKAPDWELWWKGCRRKTTIQPSVWNSEMGTLLQIKGLWLQAFWLLAEVKVERGTASLSG